MSSAQTRLPFRPSGTSPATMRCASPSTIAVLPTPGSPISTGLFFVRRESTWITRRISSSRPITGSSFPSSAACGQVAAELLERLVGALGILRGDALAAAHLLDLREQLVARDDVEREQQVLGRDVVVLERFASSNGAVEHLRERGRRPAAAAARPGSTACRAARPRPPRAARPRRARAAAAAPGRAARAAGARGRARGCPAGAQAPARRRPPPGS